MPSTRFSTYTRAAWCSPLSTMGNTIFFIMTSAKSATHTLRGPITFAGRMSVALIIPLSDNRTQAFPRHTLHRSNRIFRFCIPGHLPYARTDDLFSRLRRRHRWSSGIRNGAGCRPHHRGDSLLSDKSRHGIFFLNPRVVILRPDE